MGEMHGKKQGGREMIEKGGKGGTEGMDFERFPCDQ